MATCQQKFGFESHVSTAGAESSMDEEGALASHLTLLDCNVVFGIINLQIQLATLVSFRRHSLRGALLPFYLFTDLHGVMEFR